MKIALATSGLILIMWLFGIMQQQAFDDCINAGIQSEETCRNYSY